MEEKVIYYSLKKTLGNLLLGTLIISSLFLISAYTSSFSFIIWGIGLTIGFSFIYFGIKSISRKPQIIISKEKLYIGFKFKNSLSWNNIESISLKDKNIDFRSVTHLEITSRIKTNSPSNKVVRSFPIGNLDISPEELEDILRSHVNNRKI